MAEPASKEEQGSLRPHRLFVAFEGGGAKALVHVGALKALEERQFEFKGVAGTSAGAIIAALKAVGYTADEIVDPTTTRTILDVYNKGLSSPQRVTDILGRGTWSAVRRIRFLFDRADRQPAILFYAGVLFVIFIWTSWLSTFYDGFVALMCFVVFTVAMAALYLCLFLKNAGLASARSFRIAFNKMLCRKLLGPDHVERDIVLADINNNQHPCLRIVAADISTRRLRVFSSDAPADQALAIADIVTASMCIPFIFRPWKLQNNFHVDGGIVSNLPAWPFDEERELDFDAITVACEIESRSRLQGVGLTKWFQDLVHTALFGASILNKRGVQRLEIISLATSINLLDFDISRPRVFEIVSEATAAARAKIIGQLIDRPRLYTEACLRLRASVRPLLQNIPDALAEPNKIGRARVAVAFPQEGFPRSLRLFYHAGFENDADEGVRLPREGTVIGEAWNDGGYCLLTPPFDPLSSPGLRGLIKLFAKDIVWIFAVPIFSAEGDGEPRFVVAIDGSDVLSEDDQVQDRIIDVLAEEAERHFNPLARTLETRS